MPFMDAHSCVAGIMADRGLNYLVKLANITSSNSDYHTPSIGAPLAASHLHDTGMPPRMAVDMLCMVSSVPCLPGPCPLSS